MNAQAKVTYTNPSSSLAGLRRLFCFFESLFNYAEWPWLILYAHCVHYYGPLFSSSLFPTLHTRASWRDAMFRTERLAAVTAPDRLFFQESADEYDPARSSRTCCLRQRGSVDFRATYHIDDM